MTVGRRLTCAALLWFAAVLLMSLAVYAPEWTRLAGWSILAAIAALIPSGWLVVEHVVTQERRRSCQEIRDIARLVLAEEHNLHSV